MEQQRIHLAECLSFYIAYSESEWGTGAFKLKNDKVAHITYLKSSETKQYIFVLVTWSMAEKLLLKNIKNALKKIAFSSFTFII